MRKLACLLLAAFAITACGKKGPLLYPDMLVPVAPSGVTAQQSGSSIKLSFALPSKDLAGRNFAGLSGVTILKRDEAAGQAPGCSACTTDFSLFRKLNLDLLPPDTRRYGDLLVLLDGAVQAGRTYTYRVSAVTADNQEGALSAPATVSVVPVLPPPVLQDVRIDERLGNKVPLDLPFVDWNGAPFAFRSVFDGKKPVVLALVYYDCPTLCDGDCNDGQLPCQFHLHSLPPDITGIEPSLLALPRCFLPGPPRSPRF